MNNGEYWQKRFELLEQAAHQQGVQCYADIEKQYRQAQKQLEGQIAAWYQRFASNNGVTLAEAKRMLNAKELAELKWDVNQYIQYGQENAINGTWVKQLENASARFHISRLEALLELGEAKLDKDGNVKGLDEQIEKLRSGDDTKFLFEAQKQQKQQQNFKGFQPGASGEKKPGEGETVDFSKMSYDELTAYMEANPDAQI